MTLYFIESQFRSGSAFVEIDRLHNSKQSVVQDIISGQLENVLTVLEVNEDEGSCRTVTEDIARAVRQELEYQFNGCPSRLSDWIDQHCGAGTADALNANAGRMEEVAC